MNILWNSARRAQRQAWWVVVVVVVGVFSHSAYGQLDNAADTGYYEAVDFGFDTFTAAPVEPNNYVERLPAENEPAVVLSEGTGSVAAPLSDGPVGYGDSGIAMPQPYEFGGGGVAPWEDFTDPAVSMAPVEVPTVYMDPVEYVGVPPVEAEPYRGTENYARPESIVPIDVNLVETPMSERMAAVAPVAMADVPFEAVNFPQEYPVNSIPVMTPAGFLLSDSVGLSAQGASGSGGTSSAR